MTSPPNGTDPLVPPPVTITFTVILIVLFVMAMLSLCACRCCGHHLWNSQSATNPSGRNSGDGLDPVVIRAFPTLVYSNVKHLRRASYELECAICLLEFEDDSILRLLTACYHVFHQECIDLWLQSHKSCPVCRGNLDLSPEKIRERFPAVLHEKNMPDIHEHKEALFEDTISINIENEEEKGRSRSSKRITGSAIPKSIEKLPRWNSTGHSIVENKPDHRYTLRLPDDVKIRVTKGHTGSCITFGSLSARDHVASDEISGRAK
ncbi:RING-H2 finger protein ATL30-like [Punica granatum]|uniref:RING-type E3 ubiquitin transferase n=1 Tax=Punica granatum TaxID=22663 RepID=A0A6P8C5E6_PUNGR|nr:RING-H2 finger protein ATL30-like [Punica granatum]